ncbi:MAG: helix-turn-helix domain-containing protein [Terriglobia bacterium]
MSNTRKTSSAVRILHRRYVGGDIQRKASLEQERVNAEVARTIYELREQAGLSQKELADRVETTQSAISRLEDADYEGHSLSMLNRIAKALNQQVQVVMRPKERDIEMVKFAFREVIRGLRREQGMTIDQLARKIDSPAEELAELERNSTYRPTPLMLHKLSRFFEIPQRKLALLAGAITHVPTAFCQQASSFAAKSESFSKLTSEEKKILDEFVKFLRAEVNQE